MKKRLSLLMAALMIITMLPMSSFAAGKPQVTVQNVTTEDDNKTVLVAFEFEKTTTVDKLSAQSLRLELTNGAKFQKTGAAFEDITAAWTGGGATNLDLDAVTGGDQVTVKPVDATTAFINSNAGLQLVNPKGALTFEFKVDFKGASEGDVNLVVVDSSAPNTGNKEDSVGSQTVKLAVVKDADTSDLAITVKDAEKAVSFDGGELSQFEIKNLKAFEDPDSNAHPERVLEITLDDEDAKFVAGTVVFVDGVDATPGTLGNKLTIKAAAHPAKAPKSVIVKPVIGGYGRKASEGDVKVEVAVREIASDNSVTTVKRNTAKIGKVVDYNVTLTVVEKKKKEIPSVWGGEEAIVTVTVKGPKGSILGRDIEFKADGANVVVNSPTKAATGKDKNSDNLYDDGEFEITNNSNTVEEIKFDMKIKTSASKDGVATLTAAQRGWEAKADLAKITPKFAAKAEIMPVKKGEARETANVMITEAKAGLLEKGEYIVLSILTRNDYTQFTKGSALKVEATNGMKFGDVEILKNVNYGTTAEPDTRRFVTVQIPVKKQSSGDAAVITISGINVLVDGSATDDVIKLDARLSKKEGTPGAKVASVDYIKVVKEYALESILTVFTIGQTQYTVNGEAKTAASAPYIKNGKTMLPIRALSESLGLTVQWNGQTKTATFTDSTKVAAVTIGAEKMFVNGTPIPLAAKAELVNGTTFVELRSLATAFGVQIDWDAAAKTATVSK